MLKVRGLAFPTTTIVQLRSDGNGTTTSEAVAPVPSNLKPSRVSRSPYQRHDEPRRHREQIDRKGQFEWSPGDGVGKAGTEGRDPHPHRRKQDGTGQGHIADGEC